MEEMKKAALYARFSSQRQNETSIEAQLEECYNYCRENKYEVVGEYIDKAISAKTDDRPEFLRMIADSSKEIFEAIVVYQLDRFARNKYDSAIYKRQLKQKGVKVYSAKEQISDGPEGILIESVLEGMAEYYSAELSQKVKRNLRQNAERGWFNGGYPPFGYKVVEVDCGTYKKKKLEIDTDTAPIVRQVFEMRANDISLLDIVDYLNQKGCKTVKGNKFQKTSLSVMLKNKRYIGTNIYSGIEYPNTIPTIIDEELFDRVQAIIKKHQHSPGIGKADESYFLTTKLFCGKCKSAMVGTSGTSHSGIVYKYYTCNKVLKKKCDKKNVQKDLIEELVVSECRKLLTDENIDNISYKAYTISQEKNAQNCLMKALEKQIHKLEKNIENLMVALENGDNVDLINERITNNRVELNKTKKRYDIESKKLINLTEQQIKFFLIKLKNGDTDDMKYRKTLITLFINKIYVYDDEITMICNVGDKSLAITKKLLEDINTNIKKHNSSYIEQASPPKYKETCILFLTTKQTNVLKGESDEF